MSLSYSQLKKVAFFCLMFPTAVFLLGFLKLYIGIPAALLLVAAYLFSVRKPKADSLEAAESERTVYISRGGLIALVLLAVGWCFLSGLGNLYYQSDDWSARNAIFRDLISHDWPVIYDIKDSALVYYIGFWLPSALVGKAVLAISANLDLAFFVGNIALWLFTAFYLIVTILVTAVFVNANTKKRFAVLLLTFVLFSGLDVVGTLFNRIVWSIPISNHVEWWSQYQFSSMATCLGWVFNQAVLAWLATACFLNEKTTRNYAFIVVLCASSSPLPCVGIGIYMMGMAVVKLVKAIKEKTVSKFWGDVFTVQNIVAAIVVFPIYILYYATNLAVSVGGGAVATVTPPVDLWSVAILVLSLGLFVTLAFMRLKKQEKVGELWIIIAANACLVLVAILNHNLRLGYIFTVVFEGIVYLAIFWRDRRKEPLFYLTLGVILLCPLVRVGTAADFCMRASIPAVFVLMTFALRFLYRHGGELRLKNPKKRPEGDKAIAETDEKEIKNKKINRALCLALVVVMLLGTFTPYKEFERGVSEIVSAGKIDLVNDSTMTFDQIFTGDTKNLDRNFIATDYSQRFFYKYLAK